MFLKGGIKLLKYILANMVGKQNRFLGFGPSKTVTLDTFPMISHIQSFLF